MNQRTIRQNRAIHKLFELIADRLNEAGLEMKIVLPKLPVDINWSKTLVKENLWRPIMKAQLGVRSTKDMTTKDIDIVYETLNRFLAEMGIHEPFPNLEQLEDVDN